MGCVIEILYVLQREVVIEYATNLNVLSSCIRYDGYALYVLDSILVNIIGLTILSTINIGLFEFGNVFWEYDEIPHTVSHDMNGEATNID